MKYGKLTNLIELMVNRRNKVANTTTHNNMNHYLRGSSGIKYVNVSNLAEFFKVINCLEFLCGEVAKVNTVLDIHNDINAIAFTTVLNKSKLAKMNTKAKLMGSVILVCGLPTVDSESHINYTYEGTVPNKETDTILGWFTSWYKRMKSPGTEPNTHLHRIDVTDTNAKNISIVLKEIDGTIIGEHKPN